MALIKSKHDKTVKIDTLLCQVPLKTFEMAQK